MIRSEKINQLVGKIKAGLSEIYGNRLRGCFLYGSYAREDFDLQSDLDILIILDQFLPSYASEIERVSPLSSRLSIDYGISISTVFLKENDWKLKESPFLLNVRQEAIAA
ncbi:MAG: nucleotidyltransferase domain-containing protein [Candidatus Omnitrophica bacterium]|nr:nucleotidyltransferase domain-containing protein [Candidatus Omnitrophota bacterium]